jgi:hypothetical protein
VRGARRITNQPNATNPITPVTTASSSTMLCASAQLRPASSIWSAVPDDRKPLHAFAGPHPKTGRSAKARTFTW